MSRVKKADRLFLGLAFALVVGGYFIFASASFGFLLRGEGVFTNVALTQMISLGVGLLACYAASRMPLPFVKKYAWVVGAFALLAMILVLIPALGVSHGGARRWFSVGDVSLQPGEFFKFAFVLVLAAWLSVRRPSEHTRLRSFFIFSLFLAVAGLLFLLQPDTDSFAVLFLAACSMYYAAGYPGKHLGALFAVALACGALLFTFRPYLLDRLTVFLHPDRDPQGAGYQLQQSLIAVGSGGVFGKGFGKSIQKFERLPEPTSDSIFAVFAEEFGLVGTSTLLLLFVGLTFRGLRIAARASDSFGSLVALGCTTLIAFSAFLNFASMLGLFPFSGLALPLISRGGTSMVSTLLGIGLILNVSRYGKMSV